MDILRKCGYYRKWGHFWQFFDIFVNGGQFLEKGNFLKVGIFQESGDIFGKVGTIKKVLTFFGA